MSSPQVHPGRYLEYSSLKPLNVYLFSVIIRSLSFLRCSLFFSLKNMGSILTNVEEVRIRPSRFNILSQLFILADGF